MNERKFYPEIFAISLAALLLEVSYTRVFSFKFFYFYTYLIVGLALLGLGSGGVLIAIVPRLQRARISAVFAWGCTAAAVLVAGGYFFVALAHVDTMRFRSDWTQPLRVVVASGLLFSAYLCVGIMIAKLFASHPRSINRLYAADLLGAACGAGAAVPLIRALTPPGCVFLSGALFAVAGLRSSRAAGRAVAATTGVVALALCAAAFAPHWLPDPVVDEVKTLYPSRGEAIYSQWDPVFRVDVTPGAVEGVLIVHHDGLLGSTLHRFSGDVTTMAKFASDSRALPFAVSGSPREVLVIGAAGGHEILASRYFGADQVTGIELNPAIVGLVRDRFADYVGRFDRLPGVDYRNSEGRSWLAASPRRYDVIFFVAPDSYAAMNAASAGAYVLTESYLYTVEMIMLSLEHLTDDGILCMQFGEVAFDDRPNRTARYLTTAREALRREGIADPARHVMVASGSRRIDNATILLKRKPFTDAEAERFIAAAGKAPGNVVRYVPGKESPKGLITSILLDEPAELERVLASYRYDVSPVFDESPFFWHFARFRDVLAGRTDRAVLDFEDAAGERVLLFLLVVAAGYAAVFLLAPFFLIRETWRALPHKMATGIYFAAIGVGFMFFEIVLIQKFTLLLGYPTYSLSVTLASMLAFTGAGSLLTVRYLPRYRRALLVLLAAVTALTLFYRFGLGPVIAATLPLPLPYRVGLAVALLLPLGICLGGFMPIGLHLAAAHTPHRQQYVAWGWAVNGFFSVISSVFATVLSMTLGFHAVMTLALAIYGVATATLLMIPRQGIARPPAL